MAAPAPAPGRRRPTLIQRLLGRAPPPAPEPLDVLLLGTGYAGKSTVFYGLQTLGLEEPDYPLPPSLAAQGVHGVDTAVDERLDLVDGASERDWADAAFRGRVGELLRDEAVLAALSRGTTAMRPASSCAYMGARVEALLRGRPTPTDMLHACVRTTGVVSALLPGGRVRAHDTGGQRSQRRRWRPFAEERGVRAAIFVASADHVGKALFEDDSADALEDAVECFAQVAGDFPALALVLTGRDALQERLATSTARLPEGAPQDIDGLMEWVAGRFASARPDSPVRHWVVNGTHLEGLRGALEEVVAHLAAK